MQRALQIKLLFLNQDLVIALKSELGGLFESLIVALMTPPTEYDASQLHKALKVTAECLISCSTQSRALSFPLFCMVAYIYHFDAEIFSRAARPSYGCSDQDLWIYSLHWSDWLRVMSCQFSLITDKFLLSPMSVYYKVHSRQIRSDRSFFFSESAIEMCLSLVWLL